MPEMQLLMGTSRLTLKVVIQMPSSFYLYRELLCPTVWIFSGTVERKKYIPVHRIPLSGEKRSSLLAFHAITGCDTVSQFAGIGKQLAWKTFHCCSPELLQHLGDNSPSDEKVLLDAEAFLCKMYTTRAPMKFLLTRRDQQHSGKQRKAMILFPQHKTHYIFT